MHECGRSGRWDLKFHDAALVEVEGSDQQRSGKRLGLEHPRTRQQQSFGPGEIGVIVQEGSEFEEVFGGEVVGGGFGTVVILADDEQGIGAEGGAHDVAGTIIVPELGV